MALKNSQKGYRFNRVIRNDDFDSGRSRRDCGKGYPGPLG